MKSSHIRTPGYYERQYICRNVNSYYYNFNVTSEYNRFISPALLSNSIRNVILKNPNLALNFFTEGSQDSNVDHLHNGKNYSVKFVDEIKFEKLVTYKTIDGVFDNNCLNELNKLEVAMNDALNPLWRLIVWENKANGKVDQFVSFYCDHALFDGSSGVQFHADLIKEFSALSKQNNLVFREILFNYKEDVDILPEVIDFALEEKIDIYEGPFFSRIWRWIRRLASSMFDSFKSLFPFLFKQSEQLKIFEYKPIELGFNHKYKIINFTPTEVKEMLDYCRSEKLTMTPYILSIGMRCLEKNVLNKIPFDNTSGRKKFSTTGTVSVNGRRFYPDQFDSLKYGVCVSTSSIIFPPLSDFDDSMLLEKIKQVGNRVKKFSTDKETFWMRGDFLKESNFWEIFGNKVGQKYRDTLYTSNLGRVKIIEGNWEVKDVWFTQSNGLAFHFVFSVVSSPKGGLNIGFSYLPEYDEIADFDNVVCRMKRDALEFLKQ